MKKSKVAAQEARAAAEQLNEASAFNLQSAMAVRAVPLQQLHTLFILKLFKGQWLWHVGYSASMIAAHQARSRWLPTRWR